MSPEKRVLEGIRIVEMGSLIASQRGRPFMPGASGNICTEDFVHMLERMGYDTGTRI
jgi:hypothetical protein